MSPDYTNATSLLENWLQAYGSFWGAGAKAWSDALTETQKNQENAKLPEAYDTALKNMISVSTVMEEFAHSENISKGVKGFPQVFMRMMVPAWQGFFQLQEDAIKKAVGMGDPMSAHGFDNLHKEAFKGFSEMYEKEFRQFLQVPQLGLTRAYQEHANVVTDRFALFQTSVSEFLALLYLPVEKSLKVLQAELTKLSEKGDLPKDSKDYYKMWMKHLEGNYLTLFKSSEYNESMSKTLNALSEFITARRQVLQDYLQFLPIPTQNDMDELYKEIYLLKKRIRTLEKKDTPKIKLVGE